MKKRTLLVVILLLAGLGVAAAVLADKPGTPEEMLRPGGGLQVARQQSESIGDKMGNVVSNQESFAKKKASDPLEVALGQEFAITLASNATTGYHWELAAPLSEAVVKLVSSEYKAPETSALGAPGQEIWTFRAVGRGQTIISLKYVRPWEKDVAPVETASYIVTVR
jgi:inhibitor of cysteine peptidase